jgi:flagellar basal body L-ring protein FlgH
VNRSRRRTLILNFLCLATLLGTSACGSLLANLRRDLDDNYLARQGGTYGGPMGDNGFLSESLGEAGYGDGRYPAMEGTDRLPSSVLENSSDTQRSWLTGQRKGLSQSAGYSGEGDEDGEGGNNPENITPPTKRLYKNGSRATRADFLDESPNEGSLWASDGQTNYYFTKNKIRTVGDIVNISLEDGIIKDIGAEIKRKLTPAEQDREMLSAQERLKKKPQGDSAAGAGQSAGGPGDAAKETSEAPSISPADVDLTKSLEVKSGDTMLAEIIERYPNGNYRVRGSKRIPYKNGSPRMLTVMGVVRGSDIGDDDVVSSGKLYEYRLEALR